MRRTRRNLRTEAARRRNRRRRETRFRTDSGQQFELLGPRRAQIIWVLVHGLFERRGFIQDCNLHALGQAVAYPLAPWWRLTDWRRAHAGLVADAVEMAADLVGADFRVIGGHSDGCSTIHEAAMLARCQVLVHWSGLWPRDQVAPGVQGIFLAGQRDPFPTVQITDRAARAYVTTARTVPDAGHAWQESENRELVRQVELAHANAQQQRLQQQ